MSNRARFRRSFLLVVALAAAGLLLAGLLGAPARGQSSDTNQQGIQFEFPFEPPLPPEAAPDEFLVHFLTPPYLWPTPWPAFDFRKESGYVPPPCRRLVDDPDGAVLDCWLQRHPVIAGSIVWEFERHDNTRWRDWPDERKADLREAFVAARTWKSRDFTGPWPGDAFVDPPANQETPYLGPDEIRTVLTFEDAWKRYVSSVGMSLAAEIDAWVPWSLRDYDAEMLDEMFDAPFRQYTFDRDDGGVADSVFPGYVVKGLTQAHAATIYRFLRDENLIGPTPRATIARVLTWAKNHIQHSFVMRYPDGTEVPRRTRSETFWGYSGLAPVSAMIEGRVASHPDLGVVYSEPHHWTYGCAGTTRFLRAVLTVVNIPVQELISHRTCGHSMAFFAGEGRYLTHSDDPYSQFFRTGEYAGGELLVSTDSWNRWFPAGDLDTACANVGRRVIDLNVRQPSDAMVALHCQDLIDGNSHEGSRVLEAMRGLYTVEELEARGFWDRLDAAAETSTREACVEWRGG